MILLDTNVISEPMRMAPDPRVVEWMDAQAADTLYLSAITVAELRFGVAVLPPGRRRAALAAQLEKRVVPLFEGRVLPFDMSASETFADLMAAARAKGWAISKDDGLIAAIAACRGFAVASRDTSPFAAAGLAVINPWDETP